MTSFLLTLLLLWPQGARDTPVRRPSGAALLQGVVMTDETTPRPVRHAHVELSGDADDDTITDDTGTFAFHGLSAGRYVLTADKPGFVTTRYGAKRDGDRSATVIVLAAGRQMANIQMRLPRGAVVSGTVFGTQGEAISNATVSVARFTTAESGERYLESVSTANGDDEGGFRVFGIPAGQYVILATPMAGGDFRAGARRLSYARAFYPGVSDATDAPLIPLAAGEERTGVDITLPATPTARITGGLFDAGNRPASGIRVRLVEFGAVPSAFTADAPSSAPSGTDGTFTFPAVPSGRYTLFSESSSGSDARAPGSGRWQNARAEVTIDGRDVTGLALNFRQNVSVAGHAIFDSLGSPDARVFRVAMDPVGNGGLPIAGRSATVEDDGSFAIENLAPGKYRVRGTPSGLPVDSEAWRTSSATFNKKDVLDQVFEVGSEPLDGLTVTFTDKTGGVRGTLTRADGVPAPEFAIVVFTADRALWTLPSRRAAFTDPDSNGEWAIRGLPPGEYRIAAVTAVDLSDVFNSAFLEELLPSSTPATLTAGATITLNLRIGG